MTASDSMEIDTAFPTAGDSRVMSIAQPWVSLSLYRVSRVVKGMRRKPYSLHIFAVSECPKALGDRGKQCEHGESSYWELARGH